MSAIRTSEPGVLRALYHGFVRRVLAPTYRFLFVANESFEHRHKTLLAIEVVLLVITGLTIRRELMEAIAKHRLEFGFHQVVAAFEVSMLFVVTLWLVSAASVQARKAFRGYPFGDVWVKASAPSELYDQLIERISEYRKQEARGAFARRGQSSEVLMVEAREIAKASAEVFALGKMGSNDEAWANPEAHYLHGWLKQMPEVLWTIARPAEGARYASVIVPVMPESFEMVARGHLNSALSHLDHAAVKYLAEPRGKPYAGPLRFEAYTQAYLHPDAAHHQADTQLLIFCALQHLAALIRQFRGTQLDQPAAAADLAIVCEASSNDSVKLLSAFGFQQLMEPDGSTPLRSAAGFFLCQLSERDSKHALMELLCKVDESDEPSKEPTGGAPAPQVKQAG
ncbi:MAG: hypothetical protein QM778_16995 [Myxococcales bacterium]